VAGRMQISPTQRRGSIGIGRWLGITACGKTADALVAAWRRLDADQRDTVIRVIKLSMARLAAGGAGAAGGRAISIRGKRISAGAAAGGVSDAALLAYTA
jgi:hypothetical protein